jgi:hypothetical protein
VNNKKLKRYSSRMALKRLQLLSLRRCVALSIYCEGLKARMRLANQQIAGETCEGETTGFELEWDSFWFQVQARE